MKKLCTVLLAMAAVAAMRAADEPDGLHLPDGFHASIVTEGLGAIRHLAVRDNGDLYVSTPKAQQGNGDGGGIIALHGTANRSGYDVVFVPFDRNGKAGDPVVFADGFAALGASTGAAQRPHYRPIGEAVGPDGSLYIADSQVGRIWRIGYGR